MSESTPFDRLRVVAKQLHALGDYLDSEIDFLQGPPAPPYDYTVDVREEPPGGEPDDG